MRENTYSIGVYKQRLVLHLLRGKFPVSPENEPSGPRRWNTFVMILQNGEIEMSRIWLRSVCL